MSVAFAEYLNGKRVAVVGGLGDSIEDLSDYDVIVRINSHYIRQGGRCDVLYHSCAGDINLSAYEDGTADKFHNDTRFVFLNGIYQLFGSTAGGLGTLRGYFSARNAHIDTYIHVNAQAFALIKELNPLPRKHWWVKDFCLRWHVYPFTGVLALYHLTLYPCAEIYVTGMNLYQAPTTQRESIRAHYISPQVKFLRHLLTEAHNWIKFSEELTKQIK